MVWSVGDKREEFIDMCVDIAVVTYVIMMSAAGSYYAFGGS